MKTLPGTLSSRRPLLLALAVSALAYLVFPVSCSEDNSPGYYRVGREHMVVSISERGDVRPARVAPIRSTISSNRATLIWMEEEGSQVRSGQVIARFDSQPFDEGLVRAEQAVNDAQARLVNAEKELLIQREEAAAKNQSAERKKRIAHLKADDQLKGSGQLERRRIEQHVAQLEREFATSGAELADFGQLLKEGHVSQRERDKVADSHRKMEEELELAKAEQDNFEKYVWPTLETEALLIKEAADLEYSRVKRTTSIEVRNLEGEVTRHTRELARAKSQLKKVLDDITACEVKAPIDGVLLYRTLSIQGNKRKVQIGDSVWQGQTFMEIPDTSEFVVETGIREIDVASLRPGMPARVTLDAFVNHPLKGTLQKIDIVAREDEESDYVRKYMATIQLQDSFIGIHAGMSANVNIVAMDIPDALVIPASALLYRDNATVVQRVVRGKLEQTPVNIGAVNDRWVQLEGGLDEGDLVVLNPR